WLLEHQQGVAETVHAGAVGGRQEAGGHLQYGAFARPAGTQYADAFAGSQAEVNAGQTPYRPAMQGHLAQFKHGWAPAIASDGAAAAEAARTQVRPPVPESG